MAVQTDSFAVVELMHFKDNPYHQHCYLILQIRNLLRRDWDVRIQHIYREGKFLANLLAACGHAMALGAHNIDVFEPAMAS
ncbi:Putative ribonuclease H protein At1g65750 [Linum grandiflorum]